MIRNYFRTAFRNMLRNKYYTGIHVFGLGLGMACCLFIYLYIHFHLGFDRYHKDADCIYHIGYDLHMKETEHNGEASYAIYEA
ncbi:putative ABC transport system permease protein [bacterium A37T11]|nr:putative ABC transport system permease protein [bacterium A37T11]